MKRKFLSILTAIAVAASLSACQAGDTGQAPPLSEVVVSETTTQIEITTQALETATSENLEETQPEENIQTDIAITENTDENIETIVIANQEIPINAESVTLYISDIQNTTDVSELKKLHNLKSLDISRFTDGNAPYITGFDSLENCKTLENLSFDVGIENPNDIYVLNTLPNLKNLTIYGIDAYEDWDFALQNITPLTVVGTLDILRISHLTSLKSLNMEYNNSTDLTPIEKLENLESLQIWESKFDNYSSILELKNLKDLYICSTPMSEEMYNKIMEKLSKCKITVTNLLAE